jgi:hypothetical protein
MRRRAISDLRDPSIPPALGAAGLNGMPQATSGYIGLLPFQTSEVGPCLGMIASTPVQGI